MTDTADQTSVQPKIRDGSRKIHTLTAGDKLVSIITITEEDDGGVTIDVDNYGRPATGLSLRLSESQTAWLYRSLANSVV